MLDTLIPEFKSEIESVIKDCYALGIEMRPFYCLRSPEEQAKLWRQSRTTTEIRHAIAMLKGEGANYLAETLESVGLQYGNWATNCLPGESWHQYGQAVDCVWVKNGKACWDVSTDPYSGYQVYAKAAVKHGLTNLGPSIKDWCHVQFKPSGPHYDWIWTDELMQEKWG